jgi:Tfp pilus assembly protein PilF
VKTGLILGIAALAAMGLAFQANLAGEARREEIARHRNLGKAFYENPTTQLQAVDEFRKALELANDSARERTNYGLALLRAGKTDEGIKELKKAQQQDPKLPHTWFSLGIAYKKESAYDRAIPQLEGMLRLVPDEAVTHYNLGVLYKLTGKADTALQHFEASARLNPNLAGPHFQLFNAYRQAGRSDDAAREQARFQEIKKLATGGSIPEDLEWSFYSEISDPIESATPGAMPDVELTFDPSVVGRGVDPATAGLAVLDVDGDGRPDLLAWSTKGVQVFRNGGTPIPCGLEGVGGVIYIAPGDFNNDGLTDLAVVTQTAVILYENHNGTFSPGSVKHSGQFSRAIWLDYDHDYDLDLILLGRDSALLRNNGAAGFSDETSHFPFVKGTALDAVMFDLVPDTPGFDLAVTYSDRTGSLYVDHLAGNYQAQELDSVPAGTSRLTAFDFDSDSWTDLAITSLDGVSLLRNRAGYFERANTWEGKGQAVFADFANSGRFDFLASGSLYRNRGQGSFVVARTTLPDAVAAVTADFDGDQREDIAVVRRDGTVEVLYNRTKPGNGFTVGLTGVKNLKSAMGAKVEVKSGLQYEKQIYRGRPLHFSAGPQTSLDTLRITWANGMVQNELRQSPGKTLFVKEAPRLSGSCPMIFTWNGKRFEFVTDVLGVAPLGASAGGGQYFPVDHDEYVQIPRGALVARDGAYEVRITEELHEVSYLDQVRLFAVDHPAAEEIFTNDKFKSPPFPEFRLFGVKRRIYPVAAHDQSGRNVRPELLARDLRYPNSFSRRAVGAAALHWMDLDFGNAAAENRAVLVLNGWVDWADGSTFLAASQERPGGLITPYLQVKDAQGQWQTVIQDMGMPSGKPKTIAVDLTGKFLSASREVRIATSLCVYWDEIFLSEDMDAHAAVTPIGVASASLQFRGFSKPVIDGERRQPERFLYDETMPVSQWNPIPGRYTRYGDVTRLISGLDDFLVIMGSGDELTLRFPSASLPMAAGWTRDFLLLVDGWAKDADPNTAFSRSVEPLPFHTMSAYPYPAREHFPEDSAHRQYREFYNTRPALRLLRPLATE